jgi:antitoxin (DNA-binding transcriptional repressor) of toxin-antitoxin stability system
MTVAVEMKDVAGRLTELVKRMQAGDDIVLEQAHQPVARLVPYDDDSERQDWLRLASERLAQAYGEDEPEYPLRLIKEANAAYGA